MSEYTVRTICGSMRFYNRMLAAAEQAAADGVIVLMPFVQKVPTDLGGDSEDFKEMLNDMHRAKIDMSDGIIVVGKEYIGESTKGEIEYAKGRGIEIIYL